MRACCEMMSQDFIMAVRRCGEWSPSLHLPTSKPLNFVLSPGWKVRCLTGNSDSQQRPTKRATSYGDYPLSFFVCLFVCFTMECENAIITAVSEGGRQFRRGERRHCPRHVYRELCQTAAAKRRRERTVSGAKG